MPPVHFDGLWELRIYYETTPVGFPVMEHRLTVDVAVIEPILVGSDFSDIGVTQRNGLESTLDLQVDALVALLVPFYPSTSSFTRAELWNIPEGTFAGTWYGSYGIGESGTAGSPCVPAKQVTLTFRSMSGGTARIQLMETFEVGETRIGYPTGNALFDDVIDHVISLATPFKARDNGYFIGGIAASGGQNERLWRKRYRGT